MKSIELCERELEKLERKLGERKEAGILSAQRLMLKDPSLLDRAMELIDEGYTAEYAIKLMRALLCLKALKTHT